MTTITCPFCFEKFEDTEVYFRLAEISVNTDTTDGATSGGQLAQMVLEKYSNDKASSESAEAIDEKLYRKCKDEIKHKWWRRRSQSLPTMENPAFSSESEIFHEFLYARGVVIGAVDAKENETKKRLCPFCHGDLPKSYGLYPTKFISVVGIRGSGKTVYLSQLFKQCDHQMLHYWCGISATISAAAVSFYSKDYVIRKGKGLPAGTSDRELRQQLYTIDLTSGVDTPTTIVLYDIAGENCVDSLDDSDKMEVYGPFVQHSDAILLIIDPYQFRHLHNDLRDLDNADRLELVSTYDPLAVKNAMFRMFGATAEESEAARNVPLALVMTQLDCLTGGEYQEQNRFNMFTPLEYGRLSRKGYQTIEHNSLRTELESRVFSYRRGAGQGVNYFAAAREDFPSCEIFAVSALGLETLVDQDNVLHSNDDEPHRIEEPLLYVLNEMNVINASLPPSTESSDNHRRGLFSRRG